MISDLVGTETVVVAVTGGIVAIFILQGLVGMSDVITSNCISQSRASEKSSPEIK